MIEITEAARALVEAERVHWPAQVQVSYLQGKSNDIRAMLKELQNNVLSIIVLVMIVIVAALGWRW